MPPAARLPRTLVRFALVGLANTAIDLVLFWLLQPSLGILTANVGSTSAGMAFSFWMNGRHTFATTRVTAYQALTFIATNALTMWLLQPLVIVPTHGLLGVPLPLAKLVALGTSVVANFLLYRYVVWRGVGAAATVSPARQPGDLVAAPGAGRR